MDQNENYTPRPQDYIKIAVIVTAASVGAYHLGKLGVDFARAGIQTLKDKKTQK